MKVDKRIAKLTGYGELAVLVRVVLPSHTAKRLALLMDSEVATARFWLYRNFSRAQCRKAAALLLLELDRQDAEERAAARRRLIEIAGENGLLGTRLRVAWPAVPGTPAAAGMGAATGASHGRR